MEVWNKASTGIEGGGLRVMEGNEVKGILFDKKKKKKRNEFSCPSQEHIMS